MHVNKLSWLIALCILNACVSQQQRPESVQLALSIDKVISELDSNLPGTYNNYAQRRRDQTTPNLRLHIVAAVDQDARYLVQQINIDNDNAATKQFIWQFNRTPNNALILDFAPIINDQLQNSCQVELLPQPEGINGHSIPQTCLLPNASGQTIGLMKEFLLADGRIQLGERLQDINTGTSLINDQKLDFRREVAYTGWAGTKPSENTEWILAVPFEIHNQGDVHTLTNSADQDMGYRIELAQIRYREDQPEVLRIAVIDNKTNKQVAYSWASLDADQIGLNLDWLQVGLTRNPSL